MRKLLIAAMFLGVALYGYAQKQPSSGITKEALTQRLAQLKQGQAELQKQQAKIVADLNAYDGAIQECEHWLSEAEKAEAAQPEAPPAPEAKKPQGAKK